MMEITKITEYLNDLISEKQYNGDTFYYLSEKPDEPVKVIESPNGDKYLYEGEKDQERLVNVFLKEGVTYFLEGKKDREHIILNKRQ